MPELRALDNAKSMMRDLPPKYTAALARRSVSSSRRLPRPPASTYAIALRAKGAEIPSSFAVFILGMGELRRRAAASGRGRAENQEHCRKWRQRQGRRGGKAVGGERFRRASPEIAHIGAAIGTGVAVERLAPETQIGQADTVAGAGLRGEIADDRNRRIALRAAPQKGQYRLSVVVDHDPAKTVRFAIARIEGGRPAIKFIEIADPSLHALMRPIVEQPPG